MLTTRTLIVASSAPTRAGLASLLADAPGVCLQGDVSDSGDALARMLPGLAPDVLVCDTVGDGASLARVLSAVAEQESVPALVVLGDSPARDLPLLRESGAPGFGYLNRDSDGAQIGAAVRAAAVGLVVTERAVVASADAPILSPIAPGDDLLTPREIEVLGLMALGLPNKTIAYRLGISMHTAKFHVAQILAKFGANSRTEAVTLGARRGLVAL